MAGALMEALWLHNGEEVALERRVELRRVALPEVPEGWALIRVALSGICGALCVCVWLWVRPQCIRKRV